MATSVPAVIYSIPPSSPVHYVTYVRVYDWTPQVVYVGYTPGYYGTYVDLGRRRRVRHRVLLHAVDRHGLVRPARDVRVRGGGHLHALDRLGRGLRLRLGLGRLDRGLGVGRLPGWGPMLRRPPGDPTVPPTWGPGGWAATTGNVYHHWGSATAVTRSSAGYNAWTGNEWANHVGSSYNSRTGTLAAGQRAGVGNVYTGNYAYGSRGAAVDTRTGAAASGSRVTVGNAYTGQSASASRAQVYNPRTGETSTWDAGHSGDDLYASHDGHVYQRDTSGDWQQHSWGSDGGWSHLGDSGASRSLDDDWASRFNGSERMSAFRSNFGEMGGRFGGFRRR